MRCGRPCASGLRSVLGNEDREVRLSYFPAEGEPLPFYQKFGFVETGEWDEGEKVMVRMLEENR